MTNASVELNTLIERINAKLKNGQQTENDLTNELQGFDALYNKYKNIKSNSTAEILGMKADLYLEVLDNPEKALEIVQQIKQDLPDTAIGKRASETIPVLQKEVDGWKIRKSLTIGSKLPDFDETDLNGKPLSIANYKGKIVLLDFWATWCVPCVMELPNVQNVYEKYHAQGFEIIGISLDEDKPTLEKFIQEKNMPWPQFNDGKRFDNKLATKYGVNSIPATILVDGDGNIIGTNLRGTALETAVADAVAKLK